MTAKIDGASYSNSNNSGQVTIASLPTGDNLVIWNYTGTYNYSNGTKYVGKFVDGNFNGCGIYYLEYGDIFHEGKFKNGESIYSFSNNK
ncbi:MAG: hypothetical protein L3J14_08060 [Flavobacteriaceae bacterium]|nr:hypothetical protein [Flavobacteriaceae bacterium]